MKLDNLKKLYVEQLKDIYSAESQLVEALPKMAEAAHSPQLKRAFQGHLAETRTHVKRIEEIFQELEYSPRGQRCVAMEGLIKEGESMMKSDGDPDVIDAGLIAAAQRVEHYEIASYGTARKYAEMLGYTHAGNVLQQTLNEEYDADNKLDKIALNVNVEAMAEYSS